MDWKSLQTTILNLMKIMSREFSKRVENADGKREIACYEQFLLFPRCFQKTCTADMWKQGLVWERVKQSHGLTSWKWKTWKEKD